MAEINEDILYKEIYPEEAFVIGLFYDNPELYDEYDNSRLNDKHFGNKIWAFYFKIGRFITDRGGNSLDDITIANFVNEMKIEDQYNKYNRYEAISELIKEVKNKKENIDMYYNNIKKYNLLRQLRVFLGDKVIEIKGKYNYKLLSTEQISNYWLYQIEKITMQNNENKFDEQFLLEGLQQEVDKQNKNPETGLPFFRSKLMTRITNGWIDGELYIFGSFGGRGKTSFALNKIILSCIINKEKLVVIANEESIDRFRRNLLVTIIGNLTKEKFARHRMNEGKFSQEEYKILQNAINKTKELIEGNDKLIAFIYMENYIIEDVKKVAKYYIKRGYKKYLIDTGKPSEGKSNKARWEIMTEDMKDLYKLCKKNANGLGISLWVNVQLSDTALKYRYLNEYSLGEAKKMKNEASVLWLTRPVWDDELDSGGECNHELKCFKYVKKESGSGYKKVDFTLDRFIENNSKYYLLFTAKNRLGQDNNTGLPCLIFKVNFNKNSWEEVGMTHLVNNHVYT